MSFTRRILVYKSVPLRRRYITFSAKDYHIGSRLANTLSHFAFIKAFARADLAQLHVSYLMKFEKIESGFEVLRGDASGNASALYSSPFRSLCSITLVWTSQSCQI